MAKYLYAASVQGIQSFIFATDKLKEIIGASELVERICTQLFKNTITKLDKNFPYYSQIVVAAAGNIKMLFTEEQKAILEKVYLQFPMDVVKIAPGITISQTVVKIKEEDYLSQDHIDAAERQLQAKRNEVAMPTTQAWMIAQRVPDTGLPRISNKKNEEDIAAKAKTRVFKETNNLKRIKDESLYGKFLKGNRFAPGHGFFTDFNQIARQKPDNTWIAVIHADGNDFGKILPLFSAKYDASELKDRFREFSQALDEANQMAAHEAFKEVFRGYIRPEEELNKPKPELPKEPKGDGSSEDTEDHEEEPLEPLLFRPVVLGGDDITVIMHSEYAVRFTEAYLKAFTKHTKEKFSQFADKFPLLQNGLTACAGIAFVKSKYPMHYALELAEDLCKQAKTAAKKLVKNPDKETTPACLSFYKMESAFVRTYSEIEEEELTAQVLVQEGNLEQKIPAKYASLQLSYCPYYLEDLSPKKDSANQNNKEARPLIKDLTKYVGNGIAQPAVASRLRQVLGRLHEDGVHQLDQELFRIEQVQSQLRKSYYSLHTHFGIEVGNVANGGYFQSLVAQPSEGKKVKTHLFDVLSLLSVDTKV